MSVPRNREQLLANFTVEASQHYDGNLEPSVRAMLPRLVRLVPDTAFAPLHTLNRVLLVGDIDDELATDFITDCSEVHHNTPLTLPLEIVLCSAGGEVDAGLAMTATINKIRRDGRQVHIHVAGSAMSMAFDVLQYADHRSMEPYGFLMTHEEQFITEGSTSLHKSEAAYSAAREALQFAMLSNRTGRPPEFYKEKTKDGLRWYIGAEEALREGLIDEIVILPPFRLTPAQAAKEIIVPPKVRKPRKPKPSGEPVAA